MSIAERFDVVKVKTKFPDAIISVKEKIGEVYICLAKERLVEFVEFLRDDPETQYDYYVECVGVDYLTWKNERDLDTRFEVVHNLYSTHNLSRIFIKVGVNDGEKIPSLINVFLGAEYPEREITDLFGIKFEGNEPSGRFLLPDDWIGYPLRKDVGLGGEDVLFDQGTRGPAIEDVQSPHAGESFDGKTGSEDVSGR